MKQLDDGTTFASDFGRMVKESHTPLMNESTAVREATQRAVGYCSGGIVEVSDYNLSPKAMEGW